MSALLISFWGVLATPASAQGLLSCAPAVLRGEQVVLGIKQQGDQGESPSGFVWAPSL